MNYDVIVIGGGAAGLLCAIEAGKRGRRVAVLEHTGQIGKKIAISGGGRCNFTNLNTTPENFISANPNFCRSALARFTPKDFVALIKKHGIAYHEKKAGQLFCTYGSRDIITMLRTDSEAARVDLHLNCRIHRVAHQTGFILETTHGEFRCQSLVIATGGLSLPKIGATSFGHRIAQQFGLRIKDPRPALVPLTLDSTLFTDFHTLTGLSIDASVRCRGVEFQESILFTHRGLSGPAILQISSYWEPGCEIQINLLPHHDANKIFESKFSSGIELANVLGQHLPRRLAQTWCARYFPSRPLNRISKKELKTLAENLHGWKIKPNGTEGYKVAEVTLGGVDTDDLNSKTMEVKSFPGLFFIGEVVDVTGQLGGYNFHWAWASGYAAGQFV